MSELRVSLEQNGWLRNDDSHPPRLETFLGDKGGAAASLSRTSSRELDAGSELDEESLYDPFEQATTLYRSVSAIPDLGSPLGPHTPDLFPDLHNVLPSWPAAPLQTNRQAFSFEWAMGRLELSYLEVALDSLEELVAEVQSLESKTEDHEGLSPSPLALWGKPSAPVVSDAVWHWTEAQRTVFLNRVLELLSNFCHSFYTEKALWLLELLGRRSKEWKASVRKAFRQACLLHRKGGRQNNYDRKELAPVCDHTRYCAAFLLQRSFTDMDLGFYWRKDKLWTMAYNSFILPGPVPASQDWL